jgi:hypothetical protein
MQIRDRLSRVFEVKAPMRSPRKVSQLVTLCCDPVYDDAGNVIETREPAEEFKAQ